MTVCGRLATLWCNCLEASSTAPKDSSDFGRGKGTTLRRGAFLLDVSSFVATWEGRGAREREGEASSASAPVSRYCFEMLVEGVGLRWLTPDLV